MYQRIVVGTDGSATAQQAVEQARLLAGLTGAELHLVYGVGSAMVSAGGALGGFDAAFVLSADALDELDAKLEQQAASIRAAGVVVRTHVEQLSGAEAVLGVADSVDADLIVVGSRGMTGARRFFLGSVPNAVAHQANCSVMVVRTT